MALRDWWDRCWNWWDDRERWQRFVSAILLVILQINIGPVVLSIEQDILVALSPGSKIRSLLVTSLASFALMFVILLSWLVVLQKSLPSVEIVSSMSNNYQEVIRSWYYSNSSHKRVTSVISKAFYEQLVMSIPIGVIIVVVFTILGGEVTNYSTKFILAWSTLSVAAAARSWCFTMEAGVTSMADLEAEN